MNINNNISKFRHSFCYTRFALLAPLARLLCCAAECTLPLLFQKQALAWVMIPNLLLIQDLEPDHFARDLVTVAHTQVVVQVLPGVEPNHATVVIATPVLRVDANQHTSNSRSIC